MTLQKRRNMLAILLLAVSLLAIAPTVTRADQQNQNGTITINATGQATPIDKKATGGPATLSLTGNVHTEGNDPLKINSLTGNLQVGNTTYLISDGQGEVNKKGTIQINANSYGNGKHKYGLILHGNMQGSSLTFDSHESKLSSLFFLSLSGQASLNINQSSNSSSKTSENDSENHSGNQSENQSETENEDHFASTITQTITVTETTSFISQQNNTVTQTLNNTATTTVFGNHTVTETVNNGTTTVSNNQTVTQTVTQPLNQTITFTVTNTVANSTITQTATTTVANTTLTQTTTTTVANTTITVTTNSTTPPP